MTDDSEQIPTPEEVRHAMEKAVRSGFMKSNGDGTYGMTDAGMEYVETIVLAPQTIH